MKFWVTLVVLLGAMTVHADEFCLVKEGQPVCTIVVPKASGPAWFAAGELQWHVEKITGAKLPVVKDGTPVKGTQIQIGSTDAAVTAGLGNNQFSNQEFAITFDHDVLFLGGRDPEPGPVVDGSDVRFDQRPAWFTPMGSLYAVYDFLEKSCGVRWYAPGDDGMAFSTTKTLSVERENLRRTPALELRQNPVSGQPGSWGMTLKDCTQDEQNLLMLRLKMGGKNWLIGHSFEGFPARFWEPEKGNESVFEGKHPDYFALKANGMRDTGQMCFSSTALVAQVVKDANAYFDGKGLTYRAQGGEDYYVIGPRDMQSDVCQCDACKAKVSKADWPYFSSGKASDLVWGFVNDVQREVKKTHPDKHIACFNYFDYAYYPENVEVDRSVYGGPCLHTPYWFSPACRENDMTFYKQWVEGLDRGNLICLWMYQCFPWETGHTQGFKVFPSWHGHLISEQMKMFADDGVRGVFVCGQVTSYIDGYITIKMMDDPALDVDHVLDEFFSGYYGAAGPFMQAIYMTIEETYINPDNYPVEIKNGTAIGSETEEIAWKFLGKPDLMARLQELLDAAKVKADSQTAKDHIAAYERDIWGYMLAGRKAWDRKEKFGPEIEKLKLQPPASMGTIPRVSVSNATDSFDGIDWSQGLALKIDRTSQGYPSDVVSDLVLLHDGTNLYMRLAEPTDTSKLANMGYFGDRWEMFFARQRAEPYRQFGLMPDGEVKQHAFGQEETWHSGVFRKDQNEGGKWVIRLRVPLAEMATVPLKPGDSIFMNFIRATYGGAEPQALSPIFQTGFHCLPRLSEAVLGK